MPANHLILTAGLLTKSFVKVPYQFLYDQPHIGFEPFPPIQA